MQFLQSPVALATPVKAIVMRKSETLSTMPDQKSIDAEAADWLVRLEEDNVSAADRVAFLAWRGASARNRDAFERLLKLWGAFDEAKVLADYAVSDENTELLAKDAARARLGVFGRRSVLTGIAASVAVLGAVGLSIVIKSNLSNPHRNSFETAIGEQQTIDLPDGSVIELNTNSHVEYVYLKDTRDIRLLRGEAYFEVASDKDRPFTVQTPGGRVVAVGTAFTVRLNNDSEMDVLVSEGKVVFLPEKTPALQQEITVTPQSATAVSAGQTAIIKNDVESVDIIEPEALARKLSWRQGVLAFSGDPLAEVIADVGRYTDIVIEIDDQTLRDLPVSGYFKIGEVDEMFEALEIMAGLQAERVSAKKVRLVRMAEAGE